jgi:hypothetical protein
MFIKKSGPPLVFEIYADGRVHADKLKRGADRHDRVLWVLFKKHEGAGGFQNMNPGKYELLIEKVGMFQTDALVRRIS